MNKSRKHREPWAKVSRRRSKMHEQSPLENTDLEFLDGEEGEEIIIPDLDVKDGLTHIAHTSNFTSKIVTQLPDESQKEITSHQSVFTKDELLDICRSLKFNGKLIIKEAVKPPEKTKRPYQRRLK